MSRFRLCVALLAASLASAGAGELTCRLYDGITVFAHNPDGRDFTLTLEVRDVNHLSRGPSELLLKVYPPDGVPVVREVVPDDGVVSSSYLPAVAGWDHEAWYYATCYSRGLAPMIRWSAFSDPARLKAMPKRTLTRKIPGGQKGVYRIVVVGNPDHYVTVRLDPARPFGVSGSPEWLHGHGTMYRRSALYVPKGTVSLSLLFIQFDRPRTRTVALKDPAGNTLAAGRGADGLVRTTVKCETPGQLDGQVLTLEVSDGPGDFLLNATIHPQREPRHRRGQPGVTAVLAPDAATARALRGGAIEHDGQLFWQRYQVRYHEWLKTLKPEDTVVPDGLATRPGYVSVGSHNSPKPGSADRLMHSYPAHKNRQALNAALEEMFEGLRLIGPGDHVAIGPLRNLAYEMGCYSFFYHRPAWRILQQSDAPEAAKGPIREFVIQLGDRLAFCRGVEFVNGNALASLVAAQRYCSEASGDPLQKRLFDTYFERFARGGFGDRIGIGPSGGVQESFGYDYHYGSYVLRGWRAILADLGDPRLQKAYDRVLGLYSYIYSDGLPATPWNSRTSAKLAGGTYDPWHPRFRWKGLPGPDFTASVHGANEWFAARRRNYYALTYHGRLTPTWMGEGFHGQIGFGGGILCQLHVPGKGQVLASTLAKSYGAGMHPSNWRNFHLHSLVGRTADGRPLVAANSEHFDARLEGDTVASSGEVRESSVRVARSYTFGGDHIACSVQLAESAADQVFVLWGGRHGLRGMVDEAWEMIPFVGATGRRRKGRPPKDPTLVTALGAEGKPLGALTEKLVQAAAVRIDRRGYGVVVELDRPRPVLRGSNDTVLVQLVGQRTPASQVALTYRLVPFVGEPGRPAEAAPKHTLALLPAIESLDQVAGALAAVAAHTVRFKGKPLAELRFAVAGTALAVDAKVIDPKVAPQAVAWQGSCVELFGSMPEGTRIGQVFLVPAAGDAPPRACRSVKGKQAPAPEIRLATQPTKRGYALQALIPLSLLALDAAKGPVLLEAQVTAAVSARGGTRRATLFGSKLAYLNDRDYGRFRLAKPRPEGVEK